jgi:hypothetical protein
MIRATSLLLAQLFIRKLERIQINNVQLIDFILKDELPATPPSSPPPFPVLHIADFLASLLLAVRIQIKYESVKIRIRIPTFVGGMSGTSPVLGRFIPPRWNPEGSVADPGSGAFFTPGSGIGFFRIPDPKFIFLRA